MRKPVLLARSVYNCKPLTMEEFYVGPFIARIYTIKFALFDRFNPVGYWISHFIGKLFAFVELAQSARSSVRG